MVISRKNVRSFSTPVICLYLPALLGHLPSVWADCICKVKAAGVEMGGTFLLHLYRHSALQRKLSLSQNVILHVWLKEPIEMAFSMVNIQLKVDFQDVGYLALMAPSTVYEDSSVLAEVQYSD